MIVRWGALPIWWEWIVWWNWRWWWWHGRRCVKEYWCIPFNIMTLCWSGMNRWSENFTTQTSWSGCIPKSVTGIKQEMFLKSKADAFGGNKALPLAAFAFCVIEKPTPGILEVSPTSIPWQLLDSPNISCITFKFCITSSLCAWACIPWFWISSWKNLMSSSDFLWNSSKLILSYSTTATHSGSSSTTWSTTFAPLTMVNKNKSRDFTKRTNLPNPLCSYSNFASRLSSLTWLRNFTGDTYSLNPHQSRTLDPQAWSRTKLALIPNCQDPSLNSHPSLNVSSDLASSYLSGFGLEGKIGNLTVNCKESKVVAARQVKDRVRVYILDTQIRGFDRLIWSAPLLGYKIAELASVSSHSLFGHDYRNNNYY